MLRLVRKKGIGNLAAHDGDQVGLAGSDDIVGVRRRADVAFRLHPGVFHGHADRLGKGAPRLSAKNTFGMMPVKSK